MALSTSALPIRALYPQQVLRYLPIPSSGRLAVLLRPRRTADWALTHLLTQAFAPERLSVLTTEAAALSLRSTTNASVHAVIPEHVTDADADSNAVLPHAAAWAIAARVPHLAVADTRLSSALSAVTRFDACFRHACTGGATSGLEMLPSNALTIHRPLQKFDEAVIDATVPPHFLPFLPGAPDEHHRACNLINTDPEYLKSLDRYINNRTQMITFLQRESDAVIRSAVLEASHWGYLVVRRSALLDAFKRGRGGRFVAVHSMCRMVTHVSGSNEMLEADDENVSRMLEDLLRTDSKGNLCPLPKGRTVSGIVMRPATGRFAKRVIQAERRFGKGRSYRSDCPDDLMILLREPDHESGSLFSKRLRGNFSCAPLSTDGTPVYWDNRFVISATPISHLNQSDSPFEAASVFIAALTSNLDKHREEKLKKTELYVRQIRKHDWEKITSITHSVRNIQIPYECIRGLPAIFQKESGSKDLGVFIASPHLGLSSRSDLYFTAVRIPRFRSLPIDIDPGFSEQHFESLSDDVLRSQPRRRKSVGRPVF